MNKKLVSSSLGESGQGSYVPLDSYMAVPESGTYYLMVENRTTAQDRVNVKFYPYNTVVTKEGIDLSSIDSLEGEIEGKYDFEKLVYNNDEKIRMESSSGGLFTLISSKIIEAGGVVFGAVMETDMTVGHTEADTMEEVQRMRGSKYVQSDLYSVFEDIREKLDSKGKVLFSGTPCQVAGLNSFLGKSYDELLTVDIACHGVPAPGLWERYVNALEKGAGKKITHVNFRDKSRSWRHYGMSIRFNDGTVSYSRRDKDPYLSLFLQNMTLRPT